MNPYDHESLAEQFDHNIEMENNYLEALKRAMGVWALISPESPRVTVEFDYPEVIFEWYLGEKGFWRLVCSHNELRLTKNSQRSERVQLKDIEEFLDAIQ